MISAKKESITCNFPLDSTAVLRSMKFTMCFGNPLYQQQVETEYAVSHVLHLLGGGRGDAGGMCITTWLN